MPRRSRSASRKPYPRDIGSGVWVTQPVINSIGKGTLVPDLELGANKPTKLHYMVAQLGGVASSRDVPVDFALVESLDPYSLAQRSEFLPVNEDRNPTGFKDLRRFCARTGKFLATVSVSAKDEPSIETRGGDKVYAFNASIEGPTEGHTFRLVVPYAQGVDKAIPGSEFILREGVSAFVLRGAVEVGAGSNPAHVLLGDLLRNPDYSPDIMHDFMSFPDSSIYRGL